MLQRQCVSAGQPDADESNLLYVAITRAKHSLLMTETLRRLLIVAGVSIYIYNIELYSG